MTDLTEPAETEVLHGVEEIEAAIGREIGPTDWFPVDQRRINGFADDTEDHQWIHVDPARAAGGPFGATVAHGFLTLSLVPYFSNQLRRIEGAKMGINYGLDRVRFPSPVRVGSRLRARAVLTGIDRTSDGAVQLSTRITIEIEDNPKPACVADMLGRYYF